MKHDEHTDPDRARPWAHRRGGFEDSTRRRVEIRMIFLGLSQAALGAEMSPPMSQQQVYQHLSGQRPWRRREGEGHAIERFAEALIVPVAALEPGGPWVPLVGLPDERAT